jgi:hypothetical protein
MKRNVIPLLATPLLLVIVVVGLMAWIVGQKAK